MQTDLPHRGLRLTLGGCEAPSRGEGRALPGNAGRELFNPGSKDSLVELELDK